MPPAMVDRYADLLTAGDLAGLLPLLAEGCAFRSPFSLWDTPRSVAAAYAARSGAFADLAVTAVLTGDGRGAVLWTATVGGQPVEATEVLTVDGDRIIAVDVYLRPAVVLDTVYAAMTAAWPR